MNEREKLLAKKQVTAQEKARLKKIAEDLSSLPTAEHRKDQEAMDFVQRAAAAFRTRQGKQQ